MRFFQTWNTSLCLALLAAMTSSCKTGQGESQPAEVTDYPSDSPKRMQGYLICSAEWRCSSKEGVRGKVSSSENKMFESKEECRADLLKQLQEKKKCPVGSAQLVNFEVKDFSHLTLRNNGDWKVGNYSINAPRIKGTVWALSFYATDMSKNNKLLVNKLVSTEQNRKGSCEGGLKLETFATTYDQPYNYSYCVGEMDKTAFKKQDLDRAFNEVEFIDIMAADRLNFRVVSQQDNGSWKEKKLCKEVKFGPDHIEEKSVTKWEKADYLDSCKGIDRDAHGNEREVYVVIYSYDQGRARITYVTGANGTHQDALDRIGPILRASGLPLY